MAPSVSHQRCASVDQPSEMADGAGFAVLAGTPACWAQWVIELRPAKMAIDKIGRSGAGEIDHRFRRAGAERDMRSSFRVWRAGAVSSRKSRAGRPSSRNASLPSRGVIPDRAPTSPSDVRQRPLAGRMDQSAMIDIGEISARRVCPRSCEDASGLGEPCAAAWLRRRVARNSCFFECNQSNKSAAPIEGFMRAY